MMKRFILAFLILSLLCPAAFAQDIHIQANIGIHNSGEEKNVSFDFVLKEDGISLFSDLFPSYVITAPLEDASEIQAPAEHASGLHTFEPADLQPVLDAWASAMNSRTESGIFTGDAFEKAYQAEKGFCTIPELFSLLLSAAGRPEYFSTLSEAGVFDADLYSNIKILYRIYDSGKYASFTGIAGESSVQFTASADFSDPEKLKIVFGYPEQNKNFYWCADIQFVSSEEITVHTALSADSLKTGYKSIPESGRIMTENWTLRLEQERNRISFSGEIIPQNELNPIEIKGYYENCTGQMLYAEISFREYNDSFFSVSVFNDHQSFDLSGLRNVSLQEMDDSDVLTGLTNEVSARFLTLLTSITRAVPPGYLMKLLSAE